MRARWTSKLLRLELAEGVRRKAVSTLANFYGSLTATHQSSATGNKVPKIQRFENCAVEIDRTRGIITISQGDKVKVRVSRIPLRLLALTSKAQEVPAVPPLRLVEIV